MIESPERNGEIIYGTDRAATAPAKAEDLSAKTTAELVVDIFGIITNRYRKEIIPPHAEKYAGYNSTQYLIIEKQGLPFVTVNMPLTFYLPTSCLQRYAGPRGKGSERRYAPVNGMEKCRYSDRVGAEGDPGKDLLTFVLHESARHPS